MAMHRIALIDGEGNLQDKLDVDGVNVLGWRLRDLLESWDMHLRDDEERVLASEALSEYIASDGPRAWQLYSNDDDEYAMGVCVIMARK